MNTTAPTAEGTNLFRSPLRVTSEAVELRDITYPMSAIKSVEVLPVVTNKGGWEFWIFLFDMVCSLQIGDLAVEQRVWEMRMTGQDVVILVSAVAAFLSISYLLRWLYKKAHEKWQYIYAADLNTDYGKTLVAASHDRTYIAHIVATISAALVKHRQITKPAREETPGNNSPVNAAGLQHTQSLQTTALYEHYFQIGDGYVEVPGWSAAMTDVRYASKRKIEGRNNDFSVRPQRPLEFLAMGVTLKIGIELSPDLFFTMLSIALAIIIVISLWARSRSKLQKGPRTIDYIYIASLGVAGKDVPVLISIDHGFADKLVSIVNEVIGRRGASTRKPESAAGRSQGTIA